MYTQNSINKTSSIYVKSFPNKDSIIQMETLNSKELNKELKTKPTNTTNDNVFKNTSYDVFILLGALLSIANTEKIEPDMFMLLSGILLSL